MGKFDKSVASDMVTEYHLVSAPQVEKGPRAFWPHFGFFYKALATKISVYYCDVPCNTPVKIIDEGEVQPIGNPISEDMEWKYVSKNLSTLTQFTDMWAASTEETWQVKVFFFL